MVKKGRQQLIIKICCVIAAFVLWLYTSNDEASNKTYKITNIPVQILNEDDLIQSGLILEPNQKFTVSLSVTGRPVDVYSVKRDEFKIVADVGAYALKKGSNKIPINIVKKPNKNINVVNDGTIWIAVQVDNYVEKTLPIKFDFNGNSKDGFYTEAPVINPTNVKITGSEEYVNKVNKVLVEVEMNNSDKNIKISAPLKAVDKYGKEIKEVTLSPKNADVVVPIQKTKQVELNIKTIGDLGSNFVLDSIKPKSDNIVITGEPSDLVKIEKIDTEPLDLGKLTADKNYVKLNLVVPEGIKVVNGDKYIDAEVILDKIMQKNINLKIKVKNLKSDLTANMDKDNMSLVISGRSNIINNLSLEKINCYINLESLVEGEYTIPINVELPVGVTKVSENIKFVKVNITKNNTKNNESAEKEDDKKETEKSNTVSTGN